MVTTVLGLTITSNILSAQSSPLEGYDILSDVQQVLNDVQTEPTPKRTPLDVAISLADNRWLKPAEKEYFQEEVLYAQMLCDSKNHEERSSGFEYSRELITTMQALIQPRREAALAWRAHAEAVQRELNCSMEDAFRIARHREEFDSYPEPTSQPKARKNSRHAQARALRKANGPQGSKAKKQANKKKS